MLLSSGHTQLRVGCQAHVHVRTDHRLRHTRIASEVRDDELSATEDAGSLIIGEDQAFTIDAFTEVSAGGGASVDLEEMSIVVVRARIEQAVAEVFANADDPALVIEIIARVTSIGDVIQLVRGAQRALEIGQFEVASTS